MTTVMPKLSFDSQGILAINAAAEVQNLGLKVGDSVVRVQTASQANAPGQEAASPDASKLLNHVGVLEAVEDTQCRVRFPEPIGTVSLCPDALQPATKQHRKAALEEKKAVGDERKRKAAEPEVVLPVGLPYVLSSTAQTSSSLLSLVRSSLFKLVASSGTGASTAESKKGLILKVKDATEPPACVASGDFGAMQLCILPFGEVRETAEDKDKKQGFAVPVEVTFEPPGAIPWKRQFWISGFDIDGGDLDADPPTIPSMCPFWFLRSVAPSDENVGLTEMTMKFESSLGVTVQVAKKQKYPDALKRAAAALKITMELPCVTNMERINKGDRLYLKAGEKVEPQ